MSLNSSLNYLLAWVKLFGSKWETFPLFKIRKFCRSFLNTDFWHLSSFSSFIVFLSLPFGFSYSFPNLDLELLVQDELCLSLFFFFWWEEDWKQQRKVWEETEQEDSSLSWTEDRLLHVQFLIETAETTAEPKRFKAASRWLMFSDFQT